MWIWNLRSEQTMINMLKLTFAISSGRKEDLLCKLILKQMVVLEVFKLSKNINFSSLLYHLQKKKKKKFILPESIIW